MGLSLVTPPSATIVTLDEVKRYARVLDTSFDALLTDYIGAAQAQIETAMGRCLAPQTWKLTIDEFTDPIVLRKGPVSAVSSVKYYDTAGQLQTASASLYSLDLISDPQWIVLNGTASWPATLDAVNAVEITFVAGYADANSPAYKAAQTATRALVLHWYENGGVGTMPEGVRALIFPYTNHGF